MRRRGGWICAMAALGAVVGCGTEPREGPGEPPPANPAEPLRIAAASDLEAVLPRVISAFQNERPGGPTDIEAIYGSSVKLSQQIEQGGPFDLFLCANQKIVGELARTGAVDEASVRPYTKGSLVLIVGKTVEAKVQSIADLKDPAIKKIALANPELAPYGMAAKQALESAKLWEPLQPKLVQSENVRQAVQFATTGNADAALVGRAVAAAPEVRIVEVDPALYKPLVQALGVVKGGARKEDAEAFAQFLLGPKGQAILKDFGFSPVDPPTP